MFDVDLHLCGRMWDLVVVQFIFHRTSGWLLHVGPDLYLLGHFTGYHKSIKEFFPTINEPVYKKPRKK